MQSRLNHNAFINVILVYFLLFTSGAHRFTLAANKYLVLVFIIAFAAWYFFTDRKISDRYLLYMTVFVGLLFSLSLYTSGSLSLESLLASTMKFMIAYFILKTVGTRFVETYINVIVFLAVVSLLGYITDVMHLFDGLITRLPKVSTMGYEGVLYLFRHQYHPDRNNSIFFEPGAYQGFLNAALFLIGFTKTYFGNRRKWAYIGVILAALVTAESTTGFIIFFLLFVLFLYKSDLASRFQKMVSVGLILVMATLFASHFREALFVKLDGYLNPSEVRMGYSAENRSFDMKTDLKIIKKHVFGLGFDEYQKEFSRLGGVDITEGSSNGVTSMFASYGVPYALFIFISYYWALRRMLGDFLLANAAFVMFIMFLWGESYYQFTPISFSIIAAAFVFDQLSDKRVLRADAGIGQQS